MEKFKFYAKKFGCFFGLAAYVLGTIGGTAYLFFDKHALFGVTSLLISAMAVPFVVKMAKTLLSNE